MYRSSKTYGHEIGLSAAFRQWRAQSHCRLIHGYALSIHLEFEADELDERNWVVDFGSLKSFKAQLENTFDHKLLVAADDPMLKHYEALQDAGLAEVVFVPATGCEAFAEMIFEAADVWLEDNGYKPRVRMHHVTVREHGANSATYSRPTTYTNLESRE
jgi:6-pyruvoyltetrahydropterin/6-carboxytetrahydropterin synthase